MSFIDDNSAYESWLRRKCTVDKEGLRRKHKDMSDEAFTFLRGTYFRWAKTIEKLCPEFDDAPHVLAIGDVHVENFGTWRNVEQRLVWGLNDFDEAAPMPYALDLVRLVTSARLATDKVPAKTIARAILTGYRKGLEDPKATLLDEAETWMIEFLKTTEKMRADFSEKMTTNSKKLQTQRTLPPKAKRGLLQALPKPARPKRFARRYAGVGSLGKPRFVVVAKWHDGLIVREAKAQVASAWDWAHRRPDAKSRLLKAAWSASRSPDPYLDADGRFVFRRLAADADKIEMDGSKLHRYGLQTHLLTAMGRDLGSFHASNRNDTRRFSETCVGAAAPGCIMRLIARNGRS